jgi:hypothetical protein
MCNTTDTVLGVLFEHMKQMKKEEEYHDRKCLYKVIKRVLKQIAEYRSIDWDEARRILATIDSTSEHLLAIVEEGTMDVSDMDGLCSAVQEQCEHGNNTDVIRTFLETLVGMNNAVRYDHVLLLSGLRTTASRLMTTVDKRKKKGQIVERKGRKRKKKAKRKKHKKKH